MEGELYNFTAAALNEKWERDFGEPLRWYIGNDINGAGRFRCCEKCNSKYRLDLYRWNYCPKYGQKHLQPEDNK